MPPYRRRPSKLWNASSDGKNAIFQSPQKSSDENEAKFWDPFSWCFWLKNAFHHSAILFSFYKNVLLRARFPVCRVIYVTCIVRNPTVFSGWPVFSSSTCLQRWLSTKWTGCRERGRERKSKTWTPTSSHIYESSITIKDPVPKTYSISYFLSGPIQVHKKKHVFSTGTGRQLAAALAMGVLSLASAMEPPYPAMGVGPGTRSHHGNAVRVHRGGYEWWCLMFYFLIFFWLV